MELLNIFQDAKAWIAGVGAIGVISTVWIFIKKNGWALLIDKYSKKGTVLFKELGDVFYSLSDLSDKIDKSIKDNGSLIENNVKEAIESGKTVKAELNDVIVIIKPKK